MGQQAGKAAKPWLAGPIAKQDASKIVEEGGSGDYLIRSSLTDPSAFHLTINDGGKASHYLIQKSDEGQYVMGAQKFDTMEDVFQLLKKRGIKGRKGKITLKKPLGAKARGEGSSTDLTKGAGAVNAFYVGPLSREKAENVVCSRGSGDYLVRQSIKDATNFFLTVNDDGEPVHFKIIQKPDGKFMLGKLEYAEVGAIVDVLLKRGIKGKKHKISLKTPLGEFVTSNRKPLPAFPREEWFVGQDSLTNSKQDLCAASHGDFLIQQADSYPFLFQLFVNVRGQAKSWTMVFEDDHIVLGERRFPSLSHVVAVFRKEGIVVGGERIQLRDAARNPRRAGNRTATMQSPSSLQPSRNLQASAKDRDRAGTLWERPGKASGRPNSSRPPNEPEGPQVPPRDFRSRAGTAWNRPGESSSDPPPKPAPRPAHTRQIQKQESIDEKSTFVAPLDVEGFLALPRRTTNEAEVPKYGRGKGPNRYKNVLPNPVTRVRLLVERGQDQSEEYYNANYVRGFGGRNVHEYIAAQAPLAESVPKFIRLIWERGCTAVVMLTGLIEGRKRKCERYWPEKIYKGPGDELSGNSITVKKLSEEKKQGYVVSVLEFSCGSEVRQVKHYWYNTWPDHGVPTTDNAEIDPKSMTEMILSVRAHRQVSDNSRSPLLVHCSAGIGRSGTYIVIDQAFSAIDRKEVVDLVDLIDKIRQDRMSMVQESSQYKFAFQACIDYAREIQQTQIYARPRNSSSLKRMKESDSWKLHLGAMGENENLPETPVFALTGFQRLKTDSNDTCVFVTEEDEDDSPRKPRMSKPSPLLSRKSKRLEDQPWFRSGISREQVEQLLQSTAKGTFIVRTSSVEGHYALTLQEGDRIVSMLIVPTTSNGIRQFKLGRTGQELFSSVTELVTHYMEAPVRADAAGDFIMLRNLDEDEEC